MSLSRNKIPIESLIQDTMSLIKHQQNKKQKLTIHTNKTIMRQKQFDIVVEQNKGKGHNRIYDKRTILNPMVPLDQGTMIDTLLFRHRDLALDNTRVTMMETINVDSDDDGEVKTIASKPPPVEVK